MSLLVLVKLQVQDGAMIYKVTLKGSFLVAGLRKQLVVKHVRLH